uniref:DUF7745 domain-containing protein n=1 Tax=Fagus sylvatica TaxID=28930 RepID=A0A2N9EGM6_FAGSY
MASSSGDPDSLVTLRFYDFRVEQMRHWWTLLGEDNHADIVGFFGQFPSLMRLRVDHGLSIGEVDLVPTLEEYAGLLQLDSPFSETPVIPIQSPRLNRVLEKYLGLTSAVLRSEIIRPEETWRKANISLDLLAKYFSWSDFPVELTRDFIAGKRGWKKFHINSFKIAFAGGRGEGVPMFCTQLLQLWFCSHLQHFYRLQTPYHFERYTVRPTVNIALPFTGNSHDWVLYLLDLPLGEWSWKVTWGPAVWVPWTHCALFDGVPLPGVWGCIGYYPNLALHQFGSVQYPPRLGDLSVMMFDYVPGEDMWRLLFRIEDIWGGRLSEMVLIEGGFHADSSITPDFVEWREGWSPSFTLRPTIQSSASYSSVSRSLRASASTRLQGQLETEQVERTRVQDELDSLRSYTQALEAMRVQISVLQGDNGVLQTEVDLVHDALESNASWLNQEGFPVVTALHQVNQVMDSLGARARAVLEEHDEGDPALSTALGRFCRETCIRLGH